jgi:hypothetical protein
MSNPDIAATLDLTVPAVKARVHRARLLPRRRLRDYQGDDRLYGTIRSLRGQPELLQLRIEPHPADPERGRRDRLVALGLREGICDRVSFELLKGRRRRILSRDD